MQQLATKIFICASLTFGVLGIIWVILMPGRDGGQLDDLGILHMQALMICVFIILSSFAVSVAGKYLLDTKEKK